MKGKQKRAGEGFVRKKQAQSKKLKDIKAKEKIGRAK